MIHRCVIFHRDEKGFGFTVCGDNPVLVENVKLSKFNPVSYLSCGPFCYPTQLSCIPIYFVNNYSWALYLVWSVYG